MTSGRSAKVEVERLKAENERFVSNMENVLEIEKENAVKEFAEKLKEKAQKGACNDIITYKFIEYDYTITESKLNELLKEYEK